MAYVSITGLRLKGPHHLPRFLWHATRSMRQAQRAPGCLRAEARTVDGYHHTLSVWQSKSEMRTFLTAGAHLRAMRAFADMATGKVYGLETDSPPDWPQAIELWRTHAREV